MHDTTWQNTIIIKYRWLKKLPTYTDSVTMSEIWLVSSTIKYKDENTLPAGYTCAHWQRLPNENIQYQVLDNKNNWTRRGRVATRGDK